MGKRSEKTKTHSSWKKGSPHLPKNQLAPHIPPHVQVAMIDMINAGKTVDQVANYFGAKKLAVYQLVHQGVPYPWYLSKKERCKGCGAMLEATPCMTCYIRERRYVCQS